jgi:hypothetical protein
MYPARRVRRFVFGLLIALLAGCVALPAPGPATTSPPASPPPATDAGSPTAAGPCRLILTPTPWPTWDPNATPEIIIGTAVAGPVGTPAPTYTPAPVQPLTNTLARYQVIDTLGPVWYCDPDEWPVSHGDEPELAVEWYSRVDVDSEEIQVIAQRHGLGDPRTLTDEQKLLLYREHKMLQAMRLETCSEGIAFEYGLERGVRIAGLFDATAGIQIAYEVPWQRDCPICLAGDTRIDTPAGPVPVRELRVGMAVWTADLAGRRVPAVILRTGHVEVPASHVMVRLQLADGRSLLASPGHPAADGRALGDLQPDEQFDGALILAVERVPYTGGATYDILPSGPTGTYWAEGMLLASTLADTGDASR